MRQKEIVCLCVTVYGRKKSAECSVVLHVWPNFAGRSGVPLVSLLSLNPPTRNSVEGVDPDSDSSGLVRVGQQQEGKRQED